MPATLEPPIARNTTPLARQIKHPLAQRAEAEFKASSYYELRNVGCEFRRGTLMLSGRVSSFYLKQVAQTMVSKIDGVLEIVNGLDVAYRVNQSIVEN